MPFIIDITPDITSAAAADWDFDIKVAQQEVKGPGETLTITDSAITFPNTVMTGDCRSDDLRGQKKDPIHPMHVAILCVWQSKKKVFCCCSSFPQI